MKLPEKYDHNFEFYKYITDLLWLKPYEIQVVKVSVDTESTHS